MSNIGDQIEKWISDPENQKQVVSVWEKIWDYAKDQVNGIGVPAEAIAIQVMHSEADEFFNKNKKSFACNSCNWCCRDNVDLTEYEASIILGYIEMHDIKPGVNFTQDEVHGKEYCPWVAEDGKCSIYSVRPMICRTHCSDSEEACKEVTGHSQLTPIHLLAVYTYSSQVIPDNRGIKMREFVNYIKSK